MDISEADFEYLLCDILKKRIRQRLVERARVHQNVG